MEFVLGDGDGEVGLCLAAGGEAGEEFGVEERDPGCLGGGSPVEEGEEGSCRVIYAWILRGLLDFVANVRERDKLTPLSEKKTLFTISPSGRATISSL